MSNVEIRSQIEAYIKSHISELEDDLMALCRIDSSRSDPLPGAPFGPGSKEALDAAAELCRSYGFFVNNSDGYVCTADLNHEGEPALDILGHVDVVPGGDGWAETEPFIPVIKGDLIYGRGVSDDKGGVIAALYAMRAVKELGLPISKRCRMIIGSGEETGMEDLKHYLLTEKSAPMTISPDAHFPVHNIEKGRVTVNYSGEFPPPEGVKRLIFLRGGAAVNQVPAVAEAVISGFTADEISERACKITAETGIDFKLCEGAGGLFMRAYGCSAHASRPWAGKNALLALVQLAASLDYDKAKNIDILKACAGLYPCGDFYGEHSGIAACDECSGATSSSLDIIHLTETSFSADVDCRTSVCADSMDYESIFKLNAERLGCSFTITEHVPSHCVPAGSPFIQTLLQCYEEVTGEKGWCIPMGGSTYVHNIPGGVAFGAVPSGLDNHVHGPDEFMPVEYLEKTAIIYALAIIRLCR